MKGSGHNNSHFITVAQMSQDSIQSWGDYFSSDPTLRGIGCRLLLTFSRRGHLSRGIIVQMVSSSYPWVLPPVGSQCGEPSHILLSPTAEKHWCAAHTHTVTHTQKNDFFILQTSFSGIVSLVSNVNCIFWSFPHFKSKMTILKRPVFAGSK